MPYILTSVSAKQSSTIEISLLITIYKGSEGSSFNECLDSVYCQKEYISEIVLVKDGQLTSEQHDLIRQWEKRWPIFVTLSLDKNYGPGGASQRGLMKCCKEWVARLDADDIASLDRFKLQTEFLQQNPEVDVLGGYMPEFKLIKEKTFATNYVPLTHKEIAKNASLRSPLLNSSVIFRRKKAISAGGYEELMSHEDHLLWLAMLKNGAKFANISKLMGYYRTSPGYYKRRRGWRVINAEFIFQKRALARGYISYYQFVRNLILRIPPRLLPASLLALFYNLFLRNSAKYGDM